MKVNHILHVFKIKIKEKKKIEKNARFTNQATPSVPSVPLCLRANLFFLFMFVSVSVVRGRNFLVLDSPANFQSCGYAKPSALPAFNKVGRLE